MKRTFRSILTLILVCTLAASALTVSGWAYSMTGKVNTKTLNIHTGIWGTTNIVGVYQYGDEVTILEEKEGWGRTADGWINLDYVILSYSSSSSGTASSGKRASSYGHLSGVVSGEYYSEMAVVMSDRAEVYRSDDLSSTVEGYYTKGDRIGLLEVCGSWALTSFGWVRADSIYIEGYRGAFYKYAKVKADVLSIRSGPGTQYERMQSLGHGEKILIKERISIGGTYWGYTNCGWVCMDYVEVIW